MSDDADFVKRYAGKRIEIARFKDDTLSLVFEDGASISFADHGQDCCEHRYMTCSDDLQSFTGSLFVGWEVLDAPSVDSGGEEHEVQFLHIRTDGGTIVCETHNEHNGYYGGFSVEVREAAS